VQIIDLYLVFRFIEAYCHGGQLILGECHERRLMPLAFFALSFEIELQYHCLNVCINSGDDVAISCKKFGELLPGNARIMELIWECQVRHGQKAGVFSRISPDILSDCRNLFTYESTLGADDGSVPYFPICQGTLPWQPNNGAVMKANWYYMHFLHVRHIEAQFCFTTTC